jgi:hypothetical protein
MKIIGIIAAYALLILFLILNIRSLIDMFLSITPESKAFWEFFSGFGSFFVIWFMLKILRAKNRKIHDFFDKNGKFIEISIHEYSHALATLVLFRKVFGIRVGKIGTDDDPHENSGIIHRSSGGIGDTFIKLAPYCFPYISLIVILAFSYFIHATIGFITALHIYLFFKETRPYQTDIQLVQGRYGFVFPYIYILAFNVFFLTIILLSIEKGILSGLSWLFLHYKADIVMFFTTVF